jgi:hypothetical protein
LVFVVVAFLHRRFTFRRNEARARRRVRLRCSKADQFLRVPPVFIRGPGRVCRPIRSRPFGRGAGVRTNANRSASALRTARRRIRPPLSAPVAVPLRTATGRARYARTTDLSRSIFALLIQLVSLWEKVWLWKKTTRRSLYSGRKTYRRKATCGNHVAVELARSAEIFGVALNLRARV